MPVHKAKHAVIMHIVMSWQENWGFFQQLAIVVDQVFSASSNLLRHTSMAKRLAICRWLIKYIANSVDKASTLEGIWEIKGGMSTIRPKHKKSLWFYMASDKCYRNLQMNIKPCGSPLFSQAQGFTYLYSLRENYCTLESDTYQCYWLIIIFIFTVFWSILECQDHLIWFKLFWPLLNDN